MNHGWFCYLLPHLNNRVKRVHRCLGHKRHGSPAYIVTELFFAEFHYIGALQINMTGIFLYIARQETQNSLGQGCFATARLTENHYGPMIVKIKVHAIYGLYSSGLSAEV